MATHEQDPAASKAPDNGRPEPEKHRRKVVVAPLSPNQGSVNVVVDQPRLDSHTADIGELDRVPHEVNQDLPQPQGIGVNHRWDRSLKGNFERQLLGVGADSHQAHDVADHLPRRAGE